MRQREDEHEDRPRAWPDADQITGVRLAWTFDEFYSAMAVQGLDINDDGVFSAEELKPLAEVSIKSLKNLDYFTFVRRGACGP